MDATLPGPEPSDSENVVWLLSTAQSLWAKGERSEAIRWLDRAATAARGDGQAARASELVERTRALSLATPEIPNRTQARRMLEQTMQSSPPAEGAAAKPAPVVVENAPTKQPSPLAAATPPAGGDANEVVISSSDLKLDESDASTRRFEYPEAFSALAMPSATSPAAAKADGVLPAIRVWVVAGEVLPAVGARPAGALDAILVSSAPGVDLARALAKTR